jgi:4-hydroxy-2-oxoheptanedioate aldolase
MLERALALKERLRAGGTVIGAWLGFNDPALIEVMARAGYDYLLIDTEHTPWSLERLQTALMAFNGVPTVPMIRVPWNDAVMIKQALDLGVEGIMAPMVRTPAEVASLVAACRYPPVGIRGFSPRRASNYFRDIDAYMAVANGAIFVMPQVEDVATVEDIDAYLDVPGIDAVCVGPNDMSGTAGVLRQLDHPTVVAAVDRVYAAARARKLPVCLGISQPAEAMPALVEAGVRMPIATADLELVAKGAATALAAAKRALGAS